MPREIPEKLREDLAACRFRQKRVPYPSGSLRPSLSRGGGDANGLEEQRLGAERKLLEDILGRQPTATLASRLDDRCRGLSTLQGDGQAENAQPAAPDVVSTMARRLSTVEAANRQLRTESMAQNKELLALRRENESLRLAVAEADDRSREQEKEQESARSLRTVLDEVAELQSENDALRDQVEDMKKFLSDYGLVWVGDRGGSGRQDRAESKSDVTGGGAGAGGGETEGGRGRRLGGVAEDKTCAHAGDGERGAVRHDAGDKSAEGGEDVGIASCAAKPQPAEEPGQMGFKVDFDILFEKFDRLNALAGESIAKVVRSGRRAQLKCPDGLPLVVYRDGIFLRRGPFRSFSGRHTQAFINDIMDGYYPSEFKDAYPDGVVFRLTDRRATLYAERLEELRGGSAGNFSAFGGVGNKLSAGDGEDHKGDGPSAGAAAPKTAGIADGSYSREDFDEAKRCAGAVTGAKARVVSSSLSGLGAEELPIGRDRFLEALPASVVGGNGDIMPVRGAVAKLLGSEQTSGEGAVAFNDTRVDMAETGGKGDETVTTLRVRSDDGTQALMLRMPDSATIADLRCLIDSRRGSSVTYELRTAFPNQVYADETQTLRDAGLSPNAQLMLRVTKGQK